MKRILSVLVAVSALLLTTVSSTFAETIVENWNDTSSWNLDGDVVSVSNHTLIVKSQSGAMTHKTLTFNPKYKMSISGTIKSPDIKTNTPSYFGLVLQSVENGNYYGSVAYGNWIDDTNGVFGPYSIIFTNEWLQSSNWWVWYSKAPKTGTNTKFFPFSAAWTPTNSNGTTGTWTITVLNDKSKTKSFTSPNLPMVGNALRPALGFGRGRAEVGLITMTGTR